MKRRGLEEDACGVWLDAAALKRRKVQDGGKWWKMMSSTKYPEKEYETHLIKPGTKMLTLLPRERKPVSFTQRIPSVGIKQTSIASFMLQPEMTDVNNQRNVSSHIESQINKECKTGATQLDCWIQDLEDDCIAPPVATSTPEDIRESGVSPCSHKTFGYNRVRAPFLTMPQPNTLVCTGESKASVAFSLTQDLESSCLLDEKADSSRKRECFYGSENYQDTERNIKPRVGKCHQLLDRTKSKRKMSAKENRQPSVHLLTSRESWNRENTESVHQNPCAVSVFSWDSEKNDKESWSQLFTEDSQGQRVIAHTRAPFQDVSNSWLQSLEHFPTSPLAECPVGHIQLNLKPDLLLTQDSEGMVPKVCSL